MTISTTPIEIPVALDTPLFTQRVTLDGVEYIFRFDWNGREGRWYFSLYDITQSLIVPSIKIITNWPILRKIADDRRPKGVLIPIDVAGSLAEPPGFSELGRRVKLMYFPVVSSSA